MLAHKGIQKSDGILSRKPLFLHLSECGKDSWSSLERSSASNKASLLFHGWLGAPRVTAPSLVLLPSSCSPNQGRENTRKTSEGGTKGSA